MSGALQQAASDHAPVAALAVHRERLTVIDVRQSLRKRIECPTLRLCDVPRLPFAVAAHVEYAHNSVLQFFIQLLRGNLRRAGQWKSRFLPRAYATGQISTHIFDAHARK